MLITDSSGIQLYYSPTNASEVAKRLGITTTTLYMYLNGDGSLKEAGQSIIRR